MKTKSLLTSVITQVNFLAYNLCFYWRWGWWDRIQAIFLNLFYIKFKNRLGISWLDLQKKKIGSLYHTESGMLRHQIKKKFVIGHLPLSTSKCSFSVCVHSVSAQWYFYWNYIYWNAQVMLDPVKKKVKQPLTDTVDSFLYVCQRFNGKKKMTKVLKPVVIFERRFFMFLLL